MGRVARAKINCLRSIVGEIRQINAMRSEVISRAFVVFESQHDALARMLLQNLGDRHKAALWMITHRRAFGGRTAYDVLVEGDIDSVWDQLGLDSEGG